MKKIFTLFTASFLSLSLFAFDASRLTISTVTPKSGIQVELNGRRLQLNDNGITLRHLDFGQHNLKIFREIRRGNGFGNAFGRRELLYNGSIVLRRGFHTDIVINRFGRVFTDERRIDANDSWYYDDDDGFDRGHTGFTGVMTAREFDQARESLRKEWFENNRLNSARFVIDNNQFTTQQVRELMGLFSFENNKLEIAKHAYRKTVDRQNYYLLQEALTFNSSKEDLARFIRDAR